MTTIEESAFFSCESLTEVMIPKGVTSIGNAAFSWCRFMTEVTIPVGVITIGDHAFSYCYSLKGVVIPDGVTSLGSSAFSYGYDLTSVTMPDSVAFIGETAFEYCGSGMNLYYGGTEAQWDAISKKNNDFSGVTLHFNNPCDHDYQAVVTEPTCTEQGFTTHTCACGESYKDAFTDALRHSYTDGLCIHCGETDPHYEKPGHICPSTKFTDAPVYGNWAHDGIDYCVAHELMNGTGNGLFDPNGTVSRAQLVTILYRVAGSPETEFKGTFMDVPGDQWYSNAIEWAAENGVVNGIGGGKFGPDRSITREEIATILYRYSGSPPVQSSLNAFPDKYSVSTFASDALVWATSEELINGVSSDGLTSLAPKNNATRAQIAAIIMRYLEIE